ncbi:6-cysteine protein (P36) [Plasmodium ovale wallikeri]|uniref:6-cysteine protein (P36) n=1 Tax=Plasmodium ovale wallikeri TaxID=864142 RepID=A0A1A8YJB4_PLAOA|nr:6-cysteine protein (P36) [Plasmodium ovale wallikeri]SBT56222.1 6-cysteine protein (P36) [Plasmodium ovale wallikeri]
MIYLKEVRIGNYYICNLKDYSKEYCLVDHDYDKTIKLLCPINNDDNKKKQIYDSSYCFKYIGIKDGLIINNKQETIYETLPGIILTNEVNFDRYNLSIYAPFNVKEDVTIVCICDSPKENKGITPFIQINIKNTNNLNTSNGNYVKGCDYGNNKGKLQFLTQPVSHTNSLICEVEAFPGDIIGINCNNYTNKKKEDIYLEPSNCFATVYFSMHSLNFVRTHIDNILPDAKYYPDLSSLPKDKNFQKFSTSYLWIPEEVSHDFLLYCYCSFPTGRGVAIYHIVKNAQP